MSILLCHPSLEVVKLIVKLGGDALVTEVSKCGFNAITYACWGNASPDVIRYLVKIGGKEAVLKKSKASGANPLHYACIRYTTDDSNSLCEVIRILIEVGEYEVITATDDNGEFPFQALLLRSEIDVESVISFLDQWYTYEKMGGFILCDEIIIDEYNEPENSNDDTKDYLNTSNQPSIEHLKNLQDASMSLTRRLLKIDHEAKRKILKTTFMKEFLTEKFIRPLPLAIATIDLYIQALVVCCFSAFIKNTSPNRINSTTIKIILCVCTSWRLNRELLQLVASSLGVYLSSLANWLDIVQIFVLLSTISGNIDDHPFSWPMVFATGYSWIELLFELHNFSYPLALFVNGTIKTMKKLGNFFITTIIIVAMFAHVYYIANQHDSSFCNNPSNLNDADFNAQGGFQCSLLDSYIYSFTNMFAFKIPNRSAVHWVIPLLYSFVMGMLLLKFVIAIILEAYADVRKQSEMTFWCSRLELVNELDTILSFTNHYKATEIVQSANKSKKVDERIDLNALLPKSVWDGIQGKDKECVHWWYGKVPEIPPLQDRLAFFFKKSILKDIRFPSSVFENIILGHHRSHQKTLLEAIITIPASLILLILSHIFLVIAFIAGSLTLGLYVPKKVKRYLFSVNKKEKMISRRKSKKDKDFAEMRNDIREMRNDNLKRITENEEIKKLIKNMVNLTDKGN